MSIRSGMVSNKPKENNSKGSKTAKRFYFECKKCKYDYIGKICPKCKTPKNKRYEVENF